MKLLNYIKKPYRILLALDHRRIITLKDDKFLSYNFIDQMGYKFDIENPKSFNEKLQWLKLYDRKKEYTMMVDKYDVRKYIENIIGKEYLIPLIGIYDNFDEIDFENLPNQFVIKCTHDSGGLVICKDKKSLDIIKAKEKINKSLKNNFYYAAREWPYKDVKPRIIVEKFMIDDVNRNGLIDYKFYCFNGKVKFLYVSQGLEDHSTAKMTFLYPDYTETEFQRSDYVNFEQLPKKPKNYEQMKIISERLSKNIPFVRVDLYEINDQIYFSELTFTPCGGYMPIKPEKWDYEIGKSLELK